MTGKAIVGRGIASTPGAGGGTATWKGILLKKVTFDSWQSIDPLDNAVNIYDLAPYDSDGFLSLTGATIGSIFVPGGSRAVIPAGLAGLYRVSSSTPVGVPADPDGYSFTTRIVYNGGTVEVSTQTADVLDFQIGYESIISPILVRLAEGESVFSYLNNVSTNAVVTVISSAWLLLEYLMPWPEDDT